MQDFVAIDFETANGRRSSVCSVGIVIVRGGEIVDRFYSLIQPAPNYYTYWTTEVHGLTRRDTDGQPTFPEVWAQVADKIKGLPLVAHNRPFDESCLKAVFEEMTWNIPATNFIAPLQPLVAVLTFRAISFICRQPPVVMIWKTTIMRFVMPRLVPP